MPRTAMHLALALLFLAPACESESVPATQGGDLGEASNVAATSDVVAVTRVADISHVCMVNNQDMGRPQIPIEVDGRVYYGCCEMCKGRLANDPSSRAANDPVTGNSVDKATAVIGRTSDGRTLYFENDRTFTAYLEKSAP